MPVFTEPELAPLAEQRLARLATASPEGQPDVPAVGFEVDGDIVVSRGLDLTKTVRYRHLSANPRATIVIDDLASVDPWRPRGVKVRGDVVLEEHDGKPLIRIRPRVIWSWGRNPDTPKRFASIEKRIVDAS
jgi:pyridoxamine 5'-phosphate oxidase family protein